MSKFKFGDIIIDHGMGDSYRKITGQSVAFDIGDLYMTTCPCADYKTADILGGRPCGIWYSEEIWKDWELASAPEPECKRWRAEMRDKYYCISSYGDVIKDYDHRGTDDNFSWKTGNYFKTKEEAELTIAKLKAYQTVKDDAKGFEPDWSNGDEFKYSIYCEDEDFMVDRTYITQELGQIYFATREDAEHSLETHRAEWELLYGLREQDGTNNV